MKRNNHNKPATPTSKTEQLKAVPSPNTTTSSDDKPRKQLSSSISSLRFMNRNKPQTPASVLQAAVSRKSNFAFTSSTNIANSSSNTSLTFKSTTSRVVIPSSHKNEYSNTPSSEHPSNEAVHTQHLNPITRDHLSEQWSYINEGKLDQVIQQSLSFSGNNQEQIVESLGSSNNIEQDCDSIYAMSFYGIDSSSSSTMNTENDHTMNNNSESLASSGRLRFGTFKQQQKQEEEEEDEKTNPLKRKKDNITLPIGWQQQQQSFTKSSSKGFNKKTKHSHKPQRKKP